MVIRVAVIGCGAAGLCALRHLTSKPALYQAVGFELLSQPGGTWIYTEKVGIGYNGLPVQSSMYKNLRTNLPKEVMAFPGFPFPSSLPSFIRHQEVLEYLQSYCRHYNLSQYVKFETKVDLVEPLTSESPMKWRISYSSLATPGVTESSVFDAVMVCNGHYEVPLVPTIPGMEAFKGTILHSHDYREPEQYRNQTVVCLGAAASGQDICLDLATEAKKVFLSHNKPTLQTDLPPNVVQKPGIERLRENSVVFKTGEEEKIDTLMLCTGYRYHFPFLDKACSLNNEEERLTPLYKHIIHTDFPTLSFIGICKTICPFPQFDCQVQFVLSSLAGSQTLPSSEDMKKDIEEDFQKRLNEGLPTRYAHTMGKRQWEYNDELARLGNFMPIPRVVHNLYDEVHRVRVTDLPNYKKKKYTLLDEQNYVEL